VPSLKPDPVGWRGTRELNDADWLDASSWAYQLSFMWVRVTRKLALIRAVFGLLITRI